VQAEGRQIAILSYIFRDHTVHMNVLEFRCWQCWFFNC